MPRHFWIDTDMGSDDAVALIMALKAPLTLAPPRPAGRDPSPARDVAVVGISTVAGNVPIEQATQNALFVAEMCGSTVPVFAGAAGPLQRPLETAEWFHGKDGLSGAGGEPRRQPEPQDAVTALSEAGRDHPDLILVTLGPLTNVANALEADPGLPGRVSRCVVMGGAACTYGNVTPAAEYNIWVDPEAAQAVFTSGMPVEMVGWEFCQGEYALGDDEIQRIKEIDSAPARFTLESNRRAIESYKTQTGEDRLSFPDPVAMAVALDPEIVTASSHHYVQVETQSELTRGMTVVDKLGVADNERCHTAWRDAIQGGRSVSVTWDIDAAAWKSLLFAALQ